MPQPQQVHVDAILTMLSIAYRNAAMIWREIMPVVNVTKRSDIYFVYDKKDSYRVADDRIGPKGEANEIDWGVSADNYSVRGHALADWIDQATINNADTPLSVRADTNEFLNSALELSQEQRVANIVFAAGTYPVGNKVQLSGTAQWGGSADDPIGNVQDAVRGTFMKANTLVFGDDAWARFRTTPEVLDAVKSSTRQQGAPGGFATAPEIAALFGVDRVIVGESRFNDANPGQAASYTRLWGKHMAALHITPSVGIKTISFGKTFVQMDRSTTTDFDTKRGEQGSEYLKVAWNSDEKIVASDLGYFIEDAVA